MESNGGANDAFGDRIDDLEEKVSDVERTLQNNASDINRAFSDVNTRIMETDGDINTLDTIVSDNMNSIRMNTFSIAANM